MTDDELDRLLDEEKLLDDPEADRRILYLSEKEIIAYPLESGTPLAFTMAD